MFNFSKSKKNPKEQKTEKKSWFSKLTKGLEKTRDNFQDQMGDFWLGKKEVDQKLLDDLEMLLIQADVGVQATTALLNNLNQQVTRSKITDSAVLMTALKSAMLDIVKPCEVPLFVETEKPFVILMVGVNGAGKTTSIAKISHYYKEQNKSLMLAAGDTFRAAAVEQLQIWGQRNDIPVVAQKSGSDSASVVFDALQSATAKEIDILIADTAGRLHTQSHLMDELKKIKRVMAKLNPDAPHETMLILDAGMGQNALQQAQQFHETIGLTSISVTKLDGTAKGGIVFAIAEQLKLPIRFIGVGEQIDDLKPFNAEEFVDALFAQ